MKQQTSKWPKSVRPLYWNESEGRPRAPWRLIIFIIVAAAVANPLIIALDSTDHALLEKSLEIPLAAFGFIVSLWLLCRFVEKRPVGDYGLRWDRRSLLELALGIAIGGIAFSALVLVLWLNGTVAFSFRPISQLPAYPFAVVLAGQFLRYFTGSIFEEVVSRGVLIRTFAESWSLKLGRRSALLAAWLFTSILFGGLHLFNPDATWLGAFNISLLGLAFGVPLLLTGRLSMSIGMHLAWNIFQNNIFGFANGGKPPVASFLEVRLSGADILTGGAFGPEGSLLLPLAAAILAVGAIIWMRIKTENLSLELSFADPPRMTKPIPAAVKL